MMNIIIGMPHVEPTSVLECLCSLSLASSGTHIYHCNRPRTPFESPLSQLEHDGSSTTSMTLPPLPQRLSPTVLLIPSTPMDYYKSTQMPDISSLITEEEWNTKLACANRTLADAVREYHCRYTRALPPGFDKWQVFPFPTSNAMPNFSPSLFPISYELYMNAFYCRWVCITKYYVQPTDGYTQIHRDLAPFRNIQLMRLQAVQHD